MAFGRLFVAVTQHKDSKTHGTGGFFVQFTVRFRSCRQQSYITPDGRCRLHRRAAFPIDRAETRVFPSQQSSSQFRHGAGIAVVSLQNSDIRFTLDRIPLEEERFYRAPTEEVRMHNLVGIPAEQKCGRIFQQLQQKQKLNRSQVLNFVHEQGVVGWSRCRQTVETVQISETEPVAFQECQKFRKKVIDALPFRNRKNRTPDAEPQIIFAGKKRFVGHCACQDSGELFIKLVWVETARRGSFTSQPFDESPEIKLFAFRSA